MPHVARRIGYGPDPNQFGDLWLPEAAGPHRVVVFIHGGYWRARYSLDHADDFCQALAGEGYAVWTIEYRRIGQPGGGWPGTFADVLQAVRHIGRLAEVYHIEGSRVALMGHSAGGHLALWAAGAHRLSGEDPLRLKGPLPLCAVIALAPVSDLRRAWELSLSQGAVAELLAGDPSRFPERYTAASPIDLLPLGLPQILIHGTADDAVPYELSERYLAAASRFGDACRLITLPGCGHFEPVDPHSVAWPYVAGAVRDVLAGVLTPPVRAANGWPTPQ